MTSPPRATASVLAAGIAAIIAGVFGAVFIGLAFFATLHLNVSQSGPPFPSALRPIIYGTWIFFLLCAVFLIVTGINVLRLRNWARVAMLVIAGCELFFGIIGIGVIFVTVFLAPTEPPGGRAILAVILAVIYGVPIAVALWWLIFFTRVSVSAQFRAAEYFRNPGRYPTQSALPGAPAPPPGTTFDPALVPRPTPPPGTFALFFNRFNDPSNPLAVRIIGWYLASFVLFLPILPFLPFRFPTVFFGHTFHGPAGFVITFATMAVAMVCGFGLLLLKRWSFPLAVVYQLVAIINMVFMMRSGVMETMLREMMSETNLTAPVSDAAIHQAIQTFRYAAPLGLVIPAGILIALFISREKFFAAADAARR